MESWIRVRSPFLAHPTVIGLVALGVALLAFTREALVTPTGAAALIAGVLLFVPLEYVMHRFILHARPFRAPLLRRAQERLHYAHHKDPSDVRFVFGPLWGVLPTAAFLGVAYSVLAQSVTLGALVLAGNTLAYVHYEYAHFVAHSDIRPRTRWGRHLKAMHLWHHYKNEHYWFGVTTKTPDKVAGTLPDVHATAVSETRSDIARSREPRA